MRSLRILLLVLLALVVTADERSQGRYRVAGRIVDERGHGIEGAVIEIAEGAVAAPLRALPLPLGTGLSGNDGVFSVAIADDTVQKRPFPYGPVWIAARTSVAVGRKLVQAGTVDARLELAHARPVRGSVRDRSGAPVSGICVSTGAGMHAMTDGHGKFELSNVSIQDGNLCAIATGYRPCSVPIPANGVVLIEIEAFPTVLLKGRVVTSEGAPVRGAQVIGTFDWGTVTDDDGHFSVRELRAGVDLGAAGFLSAVSFLSVIRPGFAIERVSWKEDVPLGVTLVAVNAISGRIVDPEGSPVAGCRLELATVRSDGRTTMPVPYWPIEQETDALGRFCFGSVPRDEALRIMGGKPGMAPFAFDIAVRGAAGDRTFVLPPRSTVSGRVIEERMPIVGARVSAVAETAVAAVAGSSAPFSEGLELCYTYTDHTGAFVLRGISDGTAILASREGRRSYTHQVAGVTAPEVRAGDLVLASTLDIEGAVQDPAGAPLVAECVRCSRVDGTGAPLEVTTDDAGRFAFAGLPVARYVVEAEPRGRAASRRFCWPGDSVLLRAPKIVGPAALVLRFARAGTAQIGEGARADITLDGVDNPVIHRRIMSGSLEEKIRFAELPGGRYRVRVLVPGCDAYEGAADVPDSDAVVEHIVALVPGAAVSLVGAPRAAIEIRTLRGRMAPSLAMLDGDGRGATCGLFPEGRYLMIARSAGYFTLVKRIDVVKDAPMREIDLRAAKAGLFRVRVVGRDGSPVAGAFVRVVAQDGFELAPQGPTANDGTVVLGEVLQGIIVLQAEWTENGEDLVAQAEAVTEPEVDSEATVRLSPEPPGSR